MNQPNETSVFQDIHERLKGGDFSVKPELIQLMNHTSDLELQSQSIDLFFAVCSNEDFNDPQNFAFLEEADVDIAYAFVAGAPLSLSYGVVPYLLVLLDIWEDTVIDGSIRSALDYILSYSDHMDYDDASLEEIEEWAKEVISQSDQSKYYYMNEEFHPSRLTHRITEVAQTRLVNEDPLYILIQPTLLSWASGKRFPVASTDPVDEHAMREIFSYIQEMISMPWERGAKYYYGHKVE